MTDCAKCGKPATELYLSDGVCVGCYTEISKDSMRNQIDIYQALASPPRDVIERLKGRLATMRTPWDNYASDLQRRYYQLSNRTAGNRTAEEDTEWRKLHEREAWRVDHRVDQSTCAHSDVEPVNEDVARCLRCGDLMVI